jgi:hypothetical protein
VQWRYLDPPAFTYTVLLAERAGQPSGYIAYRLAETPGGQVGFVADLLTAPTDAGTRHTLLRHALADLYAQGAEAALTLAVPGTPLHQSFKRAGFILSPGAFAVQLNPLAADLPLELFANRQNWYLTGGDFDVI